MTLLDGITDNLEKLQKLYDTIVGHLLTQGTVSTDGTRTSPLTSSGQCAYRGDDGRKCAVGVLIEDERYDRSFDCTSIGYEVHTYPTRTARTRVREAVTETIGWDIYTTSGDAQEDLWRRRARQLLSHSQELHDSLEDELGIGEELTQSRARAVWARQFKALIGSEGSLGELGLSWNFGDAESPRGVLQ